MDEKKVDSPDACEDDICSYHTFMLPFVFKSFDKGFRPDESKWEELLFSIQEPKDYNEAIYFYEYVRNALYRTAQSDEVNFISRYYEYVVQNGTYEIKTKEQTYVLNVEGISLRVFHSGVGILSINMENRTYCEPDDILRINDFGRRVYPQFLSDGFSTTGAKNVFLADEITLRLGDAEPITENFSAYESKKNLNKDLSQLPSYICNLLGIGRDDIDPIIDDRMFVLSIYFNNAKSALMKDNPVNDWWYKYIFVDGGDRSCQDDSMLESLVRSSSYNRWRNYGTVYGISRYSFVSVTDESGFGKQVLLTHMKTIYFQMFTLLLAYRASAISFSRKVSEVSAMIGDSNDVSERTEEIYKEYLFFINRLFFREVTAQEQGIELYNKAMQVMQIEKQIGDLKGEIAELHAYADLRAEKARNKALDTISYLGAVLLPPSLLAGLLGMNVIPGDIAGNINTVLVVMGLALSGIAGKLALDKYKNDTNKTLPVKSILGAVLAVTFAVLAVLSLFSSENKAEKYLKEIDTKLEILVDGKKGNHE